MEASQDIPVDNTHSTAESTTSNKPNSTTEQASPAPTEWLLERELDRIKKHRAVNHFANPIECHFNRHIPIHWAITTLHSLFLLLSVLILSSIFILWLKVPDELAKVEGIGVVSNITLVDILYIGLMVYFVWFGIKNLVTRTKSLEGQSYRIAMLCNAFSFIVIKHIKLTFYTIAIFSIMTLFGQYHIDDAFNTITEGAFADTFNVFLSIISLVIFYRAFRPSYFGVE